MIETTADHVGAGYPFLLVVVFLVGSLQIILSLLKMARFAAIIPVSVVEGMLASIGLLIIVKQLPMFFGYTGSIHAHEFVDYLRESSTYASAMTVPVFAVSMLTLVALFALGNLKGIKMLRVVPPQLIAVIFGVALGQLFQLSEVGTGFLTEKR